MSAPKTVANYQAKLLQAESAGDLVTGLKPERPNGLIVGAA